MKIISWNVNGLNSIYEKGFLNWLEKSRADILCLQEIKTQIKEIPGMLFKSRDYFTYFNSADKKGRWGVAIYSKEKPLSFEKKINLKRFDEEGRYLKLVYPNFSLLNIYLPHGGREKENLNYKLEVYNFLIEYLEKIENEKIILAGDFNVAHTELDLARPKENQNNTMFTLEERNKIDKIVELGFTDTFRKFHKEGENFTWWPYGFKARERNLGWRIDYIFVSKDLISKIKDAFILKEIKGSDHCPIGIEIEI